MFWVLAIVSFCQTPLIRLDSRRSRSASIITVVSDMEIAIAIHCHDRIVPLVFEVLVMVVLTHEPLSLV